MLDGSPSTSGPVQVRLGETTQNNGTALSLDRAQIAAICIPSQSEMVLPSHPPPSCGLNLTDIEWKAKQVVSMSPSSTSVSLITA
jgi:hypothetical protein